MDTDAQLKQLFGACDRKGKGFVIKEELEELCLSLGISAEDSDAIFTDLDLDSDGHVTFSDFSFGFLEFLSPENEEESQAQLPVRRRASMWRGNRRQPRKATRKYKNTPTNGHLLTTVHDSKFFMTGLTVQMTEPRIPTVNQVGLHPRKSSRLANKQMKLAFSNAKLIIRKVNLTFKNLNPTNKNLKTKKIQENGKLSRLPERTFSTELLKERSYKSQEGDYESDARSDDACLLDMDAYTEKRKRESLYHAWTNFTSSLVDCNLLSLSPESQLQIRKLYKELERRNFPLAIASQVDNAVTSLIKEMGKLQKENKTLEELYNKEKTTHAKTLITLEEEMEDQVARVEERAREKANMEKEEEKRQLQEQMDLEVAEMQAHLKIFQKVDAWLKNAHVSDDVQETKKKLAESNVVNRDLKLALDDTTANLAVFRSDLAHCRLQYEEKCRELHQEREQVLEYMHQYDHVRRQLDLIHEANKRLQDTNDSLRHYLEFDLRSPSISRTSSQRSFVNRNAKESLSLSPIPPSSAVVDGDESNKTNSVMRSQSDGLVSISADIFGKTTTPFRHKETASYSKANGPCSLEDELRNLPELSGDEHYLKRTNHNQSDNFENVSTTSNSDKIKKLKIPPPPPDFSLQTRSITPREGVTSQRNVPDDEGNLFIPDRTYKVVLAGDASVGKSTFIARLCGGNFVPHMAATLGVDYKVKTIRVDNKNMVIQLWDTAGQERFRAITKCYFRRADGVLLLYDVTNERSFSNIRQWVQDINESCIGNIPLILCGNKIDLREKHVKQKSTVVTSCAGKRIGLENGAQFYETSTKSGDNIMEVFIELARQMTLCEDLAIQTSALRLISNGKKKSRCCNSGKKL